MEKNIMDDQLFLDAMISEFQIEDLNVLYAQIRKDGKVTGVLEVDTKIQYTNTKNISAPTGVRQMTFPYVILLFGGIGMAGVRFALKKRGEECRR